MKAESVNIIVEVYAAAKSHGGVELQIVQNLPTVPIDTSPKTEEEVMMARMAKAFIEQMPPQMRVILPFGEKQSTRHATVLWVTAEDYEKLGKPTVGDTLSLTVVKEAVLTPETEEVDD